MPKLYTQGITEFRERTFIGIDTILLCPVLLNMYKQSSLSRNKLLEWINDFLCTSYSKLEDTSNGSIVHF